MISPSCKYEKIPNCNAPGVEEIQSLKECKEVSKNILNNEDIYTYTFQNKAPTVRPSTDPLSQSGCTWYSGFGGIAQWWGADRFGKDWGCNKNGYDSCICRKCDTLTSIYPSPLPLLIQAPPEVSASVVSPPPLPLLIQAPPEVSASVVLPPPPLPLLIQAPPEVSASVVSPPPPLPLLIQAPPEVSASVVLPPPPLPPGHSASLFFTIKILILVMFIIVGVKVLSISLFKSQTKRVLSN